MTSPKTGDGVVASSEWESPSNIALIKYWGKKAGQIPANPSLSMTLSKAVTRTSLKMHKRGREGYFLTVNGDPDHPFAGKMGKLLKWITADLPFLDTFSFEVITGNTFPHSAGIASSASGMSAFALCLLTVISEITGVDLPEKEFFRIASFLSRMGSGSACRSLYGGYTVWGETTEIHGSSELFAIPINEDVHPSMKTLRDAILIVSSEPKSISSTVGHGLMNDHPFAEARFAHAWSNLHKAIHALRSGDLQSLAAVSENEALTLHSLIMTSPGGTLLLKQGSVRIIEKIKEARQRGIPVFYTIDAGPNIHLLYPGENVGTVRRFIEEELLGFCENSQVLFDRYGSGPVPVSPDHKPPR